MTITFTALTGASNPFNGFDTGFKSKPYLGDVDGDGKLDLTVGTTTGSADAIMRYFQNTGTLTTPSFTQITGASNPFNSITQDRGNSNLIDLDADGDLDQVYSINSSIVNSVIYYKNTGSVISPVYVNQTGGLNPFNVVFANAHVSFVDIDADGDQDAFVGGSVGTVRFYQNTGSATNPLYLQVTGASNPLDAIAGVTFNTPTFFDVDRDGDKDAVFGERFGTLRYYENTGNAITAAFISRTGTSNPFNGIDSGNYSALNFADIDGDGDGDLVVGEQNGTLLYYRNDSDAPPTPAYIERTGASNPFNGVDVGNASAVVFGDFHRNGKIDAVIGASDGTMRAYGNDGTALSPTFTELYNTSGDIFNGFDVGFYAKPSLVDLDADGDLDMLVGAHDGTIKYFRNTGSATDPGTAASMKYEELTGASNPFNGVDIGSYASVATGDLDGDGKIDVLMGRSDGTFVYYRNTGTAQNPAFAAQAGGSNPLNGVDVGDRATVTLVDVDRDGDLDAFLGQLTGGILYYKNTGDRSSAVFVQQTGSDNPFDGVAVGGGGHSSIGFVDVDSDGDLDAFLGQRYGAIKYYENTAAAAASNAAPTLTGLVASVTYNENTINAAATVVDSDVTFADTDSADLNGGNLTITYSSGGGAEDQLSIQNQGTGAGQIGFSGGTVTYAGATIGTAPTSGAGSGINGATLIVTFTAAAATPTAVDALIQNITYQNSSNSPTAARTISITVNDGDGGTSTAATTVINVTAQNDAPVVAAFDNTPSHTEGGAAVVLDNNLTLSDADSTNLTGATISISANFVSGDRLNFTDQLGITGSYNTSTGVLTLSGTTTVANYQTALRTITFDSTSDNPTAAARTISLVVTDGTDSSNTPTITQSVTPVNDVPINTVPGAQTVTAGQNLIITGISTTDADHSSAATYVLSVDIGTLTLSTTVGGGVNAGQVSGNGTASVTITGATLSAINATLADAAGLTYTHSAAGAATLTITATDASAGSDADTVAITINAAPSSGGGGAVGSPAPSNPGDVVTTPDASGNLTGGEGDDTISLTDENDTNGYNVLAGAGNDMVQLSGRGDNTVAGGQGSDTIIGGAGSDNLNGNRGNDNIFGSNSADILHGGKEDDFINGNGGNDVISGDLGHDGLRGGQGDDTITGGAGNDILWGDRGNDSLTGGADIDLFAFTGNTGNDTITDFNAAEGDRLQLNGQTYTATTTNGNTILTLADGSTITLTGLISFDNAWVV